MESPTQPSGACLDINVDKLPTPKRHNSIRIMAVTTVCLVAALAALLLFWRFAPDTVIWRSEISEGNQLVSRIDAYRQTSGHLPSKLSDISIGDKDAERFFYEQCREDRYIVWFGTTLGQSMTYDSSTHKWASLNLLCPRAAE